MRKIILFSLLLSLFCPPAWGQEAISEDNFGNMFWRYWTGSARANIGFLGYDSGTDFILYDSDGDAVVKYDGSANTFGIAYDALDALYLNATTSALTLGRTGADQDVVVTFRANTASGVLTWDEDNDYFNFSDDVLIPTGEFIYLFDTNTAIYSDTTLRLDLQADIIDLNPSSANTDLTINHIGTTNTGVYYWMEDEDYFKSEDDLMLIDDEKLIFGTDSDIWLSSSTANRLDITGAGDIILNFASGTGVTGILGGSTGLFDIGASNTIFGQGAGASVTTGTGNFIAGFEALKSGGTDPDNNVIIGYFTGNSLEGNYNTFVGREAGYTGSTTDNNTFLGYRAGYLMETSNGGVFLGYQAGYSETAANKLYISNSDTATPLIGGTFPNTSLTFTSDLTTTTGGRIVNTTRIDDGDTPYTVLGTDHVIYCDTDGGVITANLPAGTEGTHYKLINVGSSGNDLTVDPNGTEQLSGAGAGVATAVTDGNKINVNYNATEGWW